MRSVSNSLISSTSTEIPHEQSQSNNSSCNIGIGSRTAGDDFLADVSETGSLMDRTNTAEQVVGKAGGSRHSFSSSGQENTSNQPWICEKCVR